MQGRHRARRDAAGEAVPHHQLITGAQAVEKRVEPAEIVAVVAVADDDLAAARGADPGDQAVAIPPLGHMDDASPEAARKLRRAVRTAVVGHEHLALDPGAGEKPECLANAGRQRHRLVEARHQDRQLDVRPGRSWQTLGIAMLDRRAPAGHEHGGTGIGDARHALSRFQLGIDHGRLKQTLPDRMASREQRSERPRSRGCS